MGYCVSQRDSSFAIKAINIPSALMALHAYVDKVNEGCPHPAGYFKKLDDFCEQLGDFDWNVEVDDKSGDINYIWFTGDRLGREEEFFDAIAPYVEAGSYIDMEGEDGFIWRWRFNDKKCTEYPGSIVFADDDVAEDGTPSCLGKIATKFLVDELLSRNGVESSFMDVEAGHLVTLHYVIPRED